MNRVILPLAIPLGVALVTFLLIFGFSRVLLAVTEAFSENVAIALALLVAALVLGGSALVATRGPRS